MNTFYTTIDVSSLNIEKKLCLPFMIEEVEIEIEYSISKYIPANWFHEQDGGEIEDCNWKIIKVYDENGNGFDPTDKQCLTVENAFTEKERERINDAIWGHYASIKDEPDEWY